MGKTMALRDDAVNSLAMAIVESSKAPLLLLDDNLVVIGASTSFCNAFNLDPATIVNLKGNYILYLAANRGQIGTRQAGECLV